jgi:hypothetical protein
MLETLFKLITAYFINKRLVSLQANLLVVKESAADFAESRASFFIANLNQDLERVADSFISSLITLVCIMFSGFIGSMWIFTIAWNSANRPLILGAMMTIPLILGAFSFLSIKNAWRNKPFMGDSTYLISQDWASFRYGLDGTADTSEEASR